MEQKLQTLKSEIKSLLEEHPGGININAFWGLYERKYRKLPDLKVFSVRKRSEILDRCSDVYRKVGTGATALICMKSIDDDYEQQQHVSAAAVGGKETERTQPKTCKPAAAAVTSRQSTSSDAGMDPFSGGGSFYQRFYADCDTDSDSIAKSGPETDNVAHPAPRGSYSSLMGMHPQPRFAASYPVPRNEQFVVPLLPSNWNTPPAGSLAFGQRNQTPGSRDSSASRSSDGTRNVSPAAAVQRSGPPHQQHAAPTPLLLAGRLSGQVSTTGGGVMRERGRRMNYSREQLNSAAEDCIDRLSVAKDYVSLNRISLLLCQDFEVSSLDELGLRQIDDLPCVNEHKRLECKVNAYIQNFVKVRSLMLGTYFGLFGMNTNL